MFGPRETTTRFAAGLCLRTSSNWFCFRRRSSLGPGIKNGVCMIWRHNVNSSWINEEYKCKNILHAFFIHHSFAVSFIMDVTPLLWFPSALGWVSSPWCDCIHTSHRIFFWRLKHNVFSLFRRDTRSASDPDVWQMTPSHKHDARENTSSQAACSWKDTQSASRSLAKMKGTRSGDTAAGQRRHYIQALYSVICRWLRMRGYVSMHSRHACDVWNLEDATRLVYKGGSCLSLLSADLFSRSTNVNSEVFWQSSQP